MGDSVCTPIMIVEDVFVESKETFEVLLSPTPEDFFKVLLVTDKSKAAVIISDGENNSGIYANE